MTYARSRLWLGICGVGTIVTIALVLLVSQIHLIVLPQSESFSIDDLAALWSGVF